MSKKIEIDTSTKAIFKTKNTNFYDTKKLPFTLGILKIIYVKNRENLITSWSRIIVETLR